MDSVRRKLCFAALWALLAALIVSLPVSSQAQQYQAVFLSSTDEVLAQAQAISGLRAAGFGQGEITDYQPHALAWEAGQMIDIHPKDGDYWYSYALDASLLGVAGYGLNGTDFADHAMLEGSELHTDRSASGRIFILIR